MQGHISSTVAYCEIAYEKGLTKDTNPNDNDNAVIACLENHFTFNDLGDENVERRVQTGVHVLLASVDTQLGEDIRKLVNSLTFSWILKKALI
jgi:hypothetical protein